jgi:hypothetical protein
MAATKTKSRRKGASARARRESVAVERYKTEARDIAAARQAMERTRRGIEFEPERLQYVTDLQMLARFVQQGL